MVDKKVQIVFECSFLKIADSFLNFSKESITKKFKIPDIELTDILQNTFKVTLDIKKIYTISNKALKLNKI